MKARSRQPGDMSVLARRSSNARIAGTHETVGRRNENPFDPYYFSARWACGDQPPDARPDHGGCVTAIRAFEKGHFRRHRPAAHARAPAGAFAAVRRVHKGRLDAAPSFKPDGVALRNVRSGQSFAAARALRSKIDGVLHQHTGNEKCSRNRGAAQGWDAPDVAPGRGPAACGPL